MNKIKRTIISLSFWFFGVFFLLAFFTYLTPDILAALSSLALSAILIPPIFRFIQNKTNKQISRKAQLVLIAVFFFIFVLSLPNSNKSRHANNEKIILTTTIVPTTAPSPFPKITNIPMFAKATTQLQPIQQLTNIPQPDLYRIIRVIDGDTLVVDIEGRSETLRLIGIDTPETVDPRKPVQCFGREASNKAKELLQGKSVNLEADQTQGERDKYSRLLRYVFLEDGRNFNQLMIEEGYAHEYTYHLPYKYQAGFKNAQKEAVEGKRGLWADGVCTQNKTGTTGKSRSDVKIGSSKNSGNYVCNCAKICPNMTCDEAYFQLQKCGCGERDGDGDGVPCESQCN